MVGGYDREDESESRQRVEPRNPRMDEEGKTHASLPRAAHWQTVGLRVPWKADIPSLSGSHQSSSAVLCLAPAGRRCSSILDFSARLCKVEEQALTRADHCSPSASTQRSYGSQGRFAVIMSLGLPRSFCTCRLQMIGRRRDCGSHGKHALPTAPRYVAKATCGYKPPWRYDTSGADIRGRRYHSPTSEFHFSQAPKDESWVCVHVGIEAGRCKSWARVFVRVSRAPSRFEKPADSDLPQPDRDA